ncbi:Domain of unknown function DUF4149 [Burkholderiaceae bacterium]|jgi:hypothetical protein
MPIVDSVPVNLSYAGARRLFMVLSSLWVGSLLTVGYLVAPTLFSNIFDRQAAGMIAGAIFRVEAYVSLVLSVGLLVFANLLVNRGLNQFRLVRWLLLGMLACTLCATFILMPWLETIRDQALQQGMPVMLSPSATLFSRLHGISSILFLSESVLGLVLVWRLSGKN